MASRSCSQGDLPPPFLSSGRSSIAAAFVDAGKFHSAHYAVLPLGRGGCCSAQPPATFHAHSSQQLASTTCVLPSISTWQTGHIGSAVEPSVVPQAKTATGRRPPLQHSVSGSGDIMQTSDSILGLVDLVDQVRQPLKIFFFLLTIVHVSNHWVDHVGQECQMSLNCKPG